MFDPSNQSCWAALSISIEHWLLSEVVSVRCPEWMWGCNAFWISFIAAYPNFPGGEWPTWNTRIAMEGPFIEKWMQRDGQLQANPDFDQIRAELWFEFQQLVSLYFPGDLIAPSLHMLD